MFILRFWWWSPAAIWMANATCQPKARKLRKSPEFRINRASYEPQTGFRPQEPCCRRGWKKMIRNVGYHKRLQLFLFFLDDFKGKLHLLSANDETQVHLPKTPESHKLIHQPLDAQPFPEPRQFYMKNTLAQFQPRIPMPLAMNLPEIAERKAVQVPPVRGIAPGNEVRVVRRHKVDRPTGSGHPVNFRHCVHEVVQVLDDMNSPNLVKPVVAKWKPLVEVADHIGCCCIPIGVHPDCARRFRPAAAQL